jgi:phosphatidylglycerol:prolipoprotein diacylglycerol transferase
MRPILFRWRGIRVSSYPAMLYVGLVVGLLAGDATAKAGGLDGARVYAACLALLVPALIGARLASVAVEWNTYRERPRGVLRRSEGGQAMYGGLIAVPLSSPMLMLLGVPFWRFWDVATIVMLTGMIFARVGCLLNGCCAGRPTESRFGLILPDSRGVRVRRVPTQILEAGTAAGLLLVDLLVLGSHRAPPGFVFAGSLGTYALARLFFQPLRQRQRRVAGIPAIGAVSTVLVGVAVFSLVFRVQ